MIKTGKKCFWSIY